MSTSPATQLTQLTRDGVVVDVDLSEWDRRIRFVVAVPADQLSADSDVFNVDFVRASRFNLNFARRLAVEAHEDVHTRWTLLSGRIVGGSAVPRSKQRKG
jgi:hypothetical protein